MVWFGGIGAGFRGVGVGLGRLGLVWVGLGVVWGRLGQIWGARDGFRGSLGDLGLVLGGDRVRLGSSWFWGGFGGIWVV